MVNTKKRVLMVGGGSGGHVLPVVVTTKELQKLDELEIQFWCDHKTYSIAKDQFPGEVRVRSLLAGKFRRYHHLPWWQHLRPSILLPNIVDLIKFLAGSVQSLVRLVIWRPQVVFAKGGFVCLPVGLAARCLRIKLVIHDSDMVAGMANRILSRFATKIATGYPVKHYSYDHKKTIYTGIPVDERYRPSGAKEKARLRQKLGLEEEKPIILITGGGLGSQVLNNSALSLAQHNHDYQIVLISGRFDYQRITDLAQDVSNLQIKPFVNNLFDFVGASDLVIARAGATTLAELASSAALAIAVPNHRLVGGHQLANVRAMEQAGAISVVMEDEIRDKLPETVQMLLSKSQHEQQQIRQQMLSFAKSKAGEALARLIFEQVDK